MTVKKGEANMQRNDSIPHKTPIQEAHFFAFLSRRLIINDRKIRERNVRVHFEKIKDLLWPSYMAFLGDSRAPLSPQIKLHLLSGVLLRYTLKP